MSMIKNNVMGRFLKAISEIINKTNVYILNELVKK
jgi:hypothetical protein